MISFPNPNFRTKSRVLREDSPSRSMNRMISPKKKIMPNIFNGEPNLSQSFNLNVDPLVNPNPVQS